MSGADAATPPRSADAKIEVQRRVSDAEGLVAVSAYAMDVANDDLSRTLPKPVDDEIVFFAVEDLLIEAAIKLREAKEIIANGGLER